jgi:thiol-disulfide isomerase/thioredoxin
MKKIFLLSLAMCFYIYGHSQSGKISESTYPKVGDTIMNYTFTDIIDHDRKSLPIKDLRGKWLVLDWWAPGCVGCIASMPKLNKMKTDFEDKVNIILIGLYGDKKGTARNQTKKLYADLAKRDGLSLTVAFDSASFDLTKLTAVPFILVVNPEGIIKAKTYSIDSLILAQLISGKNPAYKYAFSEGEQRLDYSYKMSLPLLTNGKISNGGLDTSFIFRSILTKWSNKMPNGTFYGFMKNTGTSHNQKAGMAEALGLDLPTLIRIAYTGYTNWSQENPLYYTFNANLILNVKDRSKFGEGNKATGENLYSYSIISQSLPDSILRQNLLNDLEKNFGFKSHIELRSVPIYKLVVVDNEKVQIIRSKEKKLSFNYDNATGRFVIKNYPMHRLSGLLQKSVLFKYNLKAAPIIVDSTGIKYNIDLIMDANYFDFANVKMVLNKNGLDLVHSEKPMKCIVITDN